MNIPTDDIRTKLQKIWGPEVLLECCRLWPSHSMYNLRGNGKCGICHSFPALTNLKWEDLQQWQK
jgi:hypothetical protein